MYAEAKKAIYKTIEASLLFWKKLSKILEEMGYQRNKYDWCILKKIVNGKKWTILWNVDNLKMLHVDSNILSSILDDINTE